jgi:phage shock protein A
MAKRRNPVTRAWKYLMALFNHKLDEYADPKIQIQQAIEEAKNQHARLADQAAQVIGNQHQLDMKLNREVENVGKINVNIRQSLALADQATKDGDTAKAAEFTNAEANVESLKTMQEQASQAAAQAKQAAERNALTLQEKVSQQSKLLSQLDQAKMQEQTSAALSSMGELSASGNVPTLDDVREKIERRYANALGSAELSKGSVQGRMAEVQQASVQMAGHARLEQIKASMRGEPVKGELTDAVDVEEVPINIPANAAEVLSRLNG